MPKASRLRFVGVREFKEKVTSHLARKKEIVITRRGRPIARVVPVEKGSAEDLLLEIGKILDDAGVSKEEALKALEKAGKTVYG